MTATADTAVSELVAGKVGGKCVTCYQLNKGKHIVSLSCIILLVQFEIEMIFQESDSTDPLIPSPSVDSLASGSSDLASVRPIPPPKLYTDTVLPLNPASLSAAPGVRGHGTTAASATPSTSLYAVTNSTNSTVESKTFNSSEISV